MTASGMRRSVAALIGCSSLGALAVPAVGVSGARAKVGAVAVERPLLVAAGPAGVYVESFDETIRRLDPGRMRFAAKVKLADQHHGFAVGKGAVWAPLGRYPDGKTGRLVRLDPVSLRVTATMPLPAVGIGVTASRSGVWVTLTSNRVVRVNPATMRITATVDVGSIAGWLTRGAGSVWASSGERTTITRIDEATGRVLATVHLPDQPGPVAFLRGSVWVFTGSNRLLRISPASNTVSGSVKLPCPGFAGVEDSPVALAASGTSLWVPGHGYVARVDAVTSKVTGVVTVGGEELVPLGGAAVRSGAVWVTDILDDTVLRVPFAAVTHRPSAPC